MPIITHALLYVAYALISLTTGLALNQVGGETGGSAFLGGLALFSACAVTHAGYRASFAAGTHRRRGKAHQGRHGAACARRTAK